MPSFELSKLQAVASPRALSETDRTPIDQRVTAGGSGALDAAGSAAGKTGVSIEVGASLDPAQPPVNQDRVSQIREALRDGSYPLVPTEIADAMIAAQLSFRTAQ